MQQYEAGVLIDTHGCREDEIRTLALALKLLRQISLGDFDYLEKFLKVTLSQELYGEEEVSKKINHLIRKTNRVLWKNRDRWSLFDKQTNIYAILAHGLERRLACDLSEAERTGRYLMDRYTHSLEAP